MCGFVVSICTNTAGLDNKISDDILLRGVDLYNSVVHRHDETHLHFEFAQLFISTPKIEQPLQSNEFTLVLNGEIYNYKELAVRLQIDEKKFNDVSIFFQHIVRFGLVNTIENTNGMYTGLLFNKTTGHCELFTDHIGKKPLLIWNSKVGWHVGTGIDTSYVDSSTKKLKVLSPGLYTFDIKTGGVSEKYKHKLPKSHNLSLINTLKSSIALRVPETKPFAVALSGGLDSSIIAYILETKLCTRARYFVVGEELPTSVITLMKTLNICPSRVELIKPPLASELPQLIKQTCRIAKSFNPSIISNGLATLLLSKAVHKNGIRVMISGEGADEFFCGYQGMYNGQNDPIKMRNRLVDDLHFTELRRLDLICASFSIEARCPFLDHRLTQMAMAYDNNSLCDIHMNKGKVILRDSFKGMLPDSIINAPKEPFDITSGLQKLVIDELNKATGSEREALKSIFRKSFDNALIAEHSYFSHYPAFDEMIDRRDLKYQ